MAWYYKAALGAGGTSKGIQSWLEGIATVGRVPLAGTYISETTADRRDGAKAIRIAEFFEDCNCFRLTSDVKTI